MKDRHVTHAEVVAAFDAWADAWAQKATEKDEHPRDATIAAQTAGEIREFTLEIRTSQEMQGMAAPISDFCKLGAKLPSWRKVWITVEKSNFLYRVLVLGQPVRIRACPAHKGHWSGIPTPLAWVRDRLYFDDPYVCGCEGTGWLPKGAPMPEVVTFDDAGHCSHCGMANPVNPMGFNPFICLSCERQAQPRRLR